MLTNHSLTSHNVRRLQAILVPSLGDVIFVSTLAVLIFGIGNGLLYDGDIGYHIRAGEEILKSWKVPTHDIFSFHSPAIPWTAHEWLAEIIFALAYEFSGLTGVVILASLLLAATPCLLFFHLTQKDPRLFLIAVTMLLATATTASHWLARPHVFSLLFTMIWYRLLDQFQFANQNKLYFLPLTMIFWVNLHGGYFFGLLLIGVYACGNLLSSFSTPPGESRQQRQKFIVLLSCLALTMVACGVNPRGYDLLLFPLKLTSDRFIMDNVVEFLSPNFHEPLPFKYMFLATMGLAVVARSRLNLIECGMLMLLSYMALYSARYMSLYGIIVAPIFLKCLVGAIESLPGWIISFLHTRDANLASINQRVHGHFWPIGMILLILALGLSGNLKLTFDEKRFPVAAVNFLLREPISGRMFNHDEFGDYLAFAAWPEYRVFIDGRSDMYGEGWINAYLQIANVQPGWRETLSRNGISWVIYDTHSALSAALATDAAWQPIYSDQVATIFLMRNQEHAAILKKYPAVEIAFAKKNLPNQSPSQLNSPH
jgi:hypothetical protein